MLSIKPLKIFSNAKPLIFGLDSYQIHTISPVTAKVINLLFTKIGLFVEFIDIDYIIDVDITHTKIYSSKL
jgi:hypothetical protein